MTRRSSFPLAAFLVVALIVAAALLINQPGGSPDIASRLSAAFARPKAAAPADVHYAEADNVSALRWQAMAQYYADNDLLTRFDSAHAADVSAARWQATAKYYADHDLLTRFDSAHAADVSATRWQAMARFYEEQGLLNNR